MRIHSTRLLLAALVLATACDAQPSVDAAVADAPILEPCPRDLDLLFVIDDSGYAVSWQLQTTIQFPRLFSRLASGDVDEDGTPDFEPVRSLHLGVVTADMGVGFMEGAFCTPLGDDGVMVADAPGLSHCEPSYPSAIFEFVNGRDDAVALSVAVSCVASLGTSGCGFEQPLDAALKALSPAPRADGSSPVDWTRDGYMPPIFRGGAIGHGGAGGQNEGFLRADSALAIIVVADEDDCATDDLALYDERDPRFGSGNRTSRCWLFPEALFPVQRYVDGLVGLRRDPRRLMFGAITGVPAEAVESGLDYDAILALDDMQARLDPVTHALVPSCVAPGALGEAYPPRRVVEVARDLDQLGAQTSLASICSGANFDSAFDSFLSAMVETLAQECAR